MLGVDFDVQEDAEFIKHAKNNVETVSIDKTLTIIKQ